MKIIDTRKGNLPQNRIINDKDVTQLLGFRQELRAHFTSRKDAIMNLIDALASNTAAKSIAELSLNPIFDYQYASVYDAINTSISCNESGFSFRLLGTQTRTETEQQPTQRVQS